MVSSYIHSFQFILLTATGCNKLLHYRTNRDNTLLSLSPRIVEIRIQSATSENHLVYHDGKYFVQRNIEGLSLVRPVFESLALKKKF